MRRELFDLILCLFSALCLLSENSIQRVYETLCRSAMVYAT